MMVFRLYMPQAGHIRWGSLRLPHSGQGVKRARVRLSFDLRRMLTLDLDLRYLGTAMKFSVIIDSNTEADYTMKICNDRTKDIPFEQLQNHLNFAGE